MTTRKYLDILIDDSRNEKITELAKRSLKERYYVGDESSPQEAFARAAVAFADDLAHAQRIYDYASKHWFMFATPILSNGGSDRGQSISCFLSSVVDSRKGLSDHYDENIWLASNGGGIGSYWGHVRSDGELTSCGSKSSGSIPFLHVVDSQMLAFNQGTTRRGSYAAYQDISHPEIEEFIGLRKLTGGDIHRKCMNLHHGVNIPDSFMRIIETCLNDPDVNDDWDLIDPHSKKVVRTVSAKELWARILETRVETGEPFIHFVDRSNECLPATQKELGLRVYHSNLCTEILLATDALRTAVCCLSSLNLTCWDEWKDTDIIADLVRYLDNVLSHFIWSTFSKDRLDDLQRVSEEYESLLRRNRGKLSEQEICRLDAQMIGLCNPGMEGLRRAAFSAYRERSLGLGTMGWHALLQSKNIPFESAIAIGLNKTIYSHIQKKAIEASIQLAKERGEAPDMIGTGRRNAHLLAVAPNASSGDICGETSPSIELFSACAYTKKTLSGSSLHKNKYLTKLLEEKGQNTAEVWKSIIAHNGSVQQLEFLDDWEKSVFKTAMETDQHWIVEHAAIRQPYICQGQSLNLFFRPDEEISYLHSAHFNAWQKGLKTLYYCRSSALRRAENVEIKVERQNLVKDDVCLSCEG